MQTSTVTAASTTKFLLTVTQPGGTIFKQTSDDSTDLPSELKYQVPENAAIGVKAFRQVENNHYLVTFSLELGCDRFNTWYVFKPHVLIKAI